MPAPCSQAAVSAARDERLLLSREAALAGDAELAGRLAAAFECAQCHATLPTARLLELHVSELHDSFFAAQAARRMQARACVCWPANPLPMPLLAGCSPAHPPVCRCWQGSPAHPHLLAAPARSPVHGWRPIDHDLLYGSAA